MAQFNIKPGAEFAHSNTVSVRVAHVADLDETIKKFASGSSFTKSSPRVSEPQVMLGVTA